MFVDSVLVLVDLCHSAIKLLVIEDLHSPAAVGERERGWGEGEGLNTRRVF